VGTEQLCGRHMRKLKRTGGLDLAGSKELLEGLGLRGLRDSTSGHYGQRLESAFTDLSEELD
jgi:hypothetical protein